MVNGDEFTLVLSRQRVKPGPILIQFVNRGEDPHDLRLMKTTSTAETRFPEIRSGKLAEVETRVSAGRYRLWCSLPRHASRGMRASLRVKR
jgi:hypothetical protein